MGRVLRFTRPHNSPAPEARYPRFAEVTAHIAHIADEVFDAPRSLEHGAKLYGELEDHIAAEQRELLAKVYEATLAHEEKFEHAAYLVGLMAGSGQLPQRVAFLDQRMAPDRAQEDEDGITDVDDGRTRA